MPRRIAEELPFRKAVERVTNELIEAENTGRKANVWLLGSMYHGKRSFAEAVVEKYAAETSLKNIIVEQPKDASETLPPFLKAPKKVKNFHIISILHQQPKNEKIREWKRKIASSRKVLTAFVNDPNRPAESQPPKETILRTVDLWIDNLEKTAPFGITGGPLKPWRMKKGRE